LAEAQHGVVGRWQLLALGIGPKLIEQWLKTERIEIVDRGVYSLSERLLTQRGRWMAGVLASGPDAVLSHRSAAALWEIKNYLGPTHVTTSRKLKPQPGFLPHCLPLAPDERTRKDGIPVTTPGRTLFDIAHGLRRHELEKAMSETEYLRLSGGPSLPELVARYPRRTGVRAVRRLLEHGFSDAPTRSELEERSLPQPERNALVDLGDRRVEVDFLWRQSLLVVELDGYAAHGTLFAFEDDRERDRLLQLAGFRVIRVTWRQLQADEPALARDLRAASLRAA
jgi:hypothetical protein